MTRDRTHGFHMPSFKRARSTIAPSETKCGRSLIARPARRVYRALSTARWKRGSVETSTSCPLLTMSISTITICPAPRCCRRECQHQCRKKHRRAEALSAPPSSCMRIAECRDCRPSWLAARPESHLKSVRSDADIIVAIGAPAAAPHPMRCTAP
jgi:hypothetical protein